MKKVRYFALALVLVLGLMGGAYAAWTDSIVVSGTADTGNFDVRFSSSKTTASGSDYDDISYAIENDVLVVTMSDLYPRGEDEDDYSTLNVGIQNDGTVPAALKSIEINRISGSDVTVYNALKVRIEGDRVMYLSELENFVNGIIEFNEEEVLEPNQYSDARPELQKYLQYEIFLCEEALNNTQNISDVKFELNYNFIQANLFDWEQ